MPIQFYEPKPPAPEPAVAAFLLTRNGRQARPEARVFQVRWDDPDVGSLYGARAAVHHLYALGAPPTELAQNVAAYDGRVLAGTLPIGEDRGGNQILLGLVGARRGRVYFWLHNLPGDYDETDPANLGVVADSFAAFLDGLTSRKR